MKRTPEMLKEELDNYQTEINYQLKTIQEAELEASRVCAEREKVEDEFNRLMGWKYVEGY